MTPNLPELHFAILNFISKKHVSKERLIQEFQSYRHDEHDINDALEYLLEDFGYIKLQRRRKSGIYNLDYRPQDKDFHNVYLTTALGQSYIERQNSNFNQNIFSNNSNSNFAVNSPNARQSIDVDSLPDDMQEQIKVISESIKNKDANTLKKAFAYIADKSVDVAIALLTGKIVQ